MSRRLVRALACALVPVAVFGAASSASRTARSADEAAKALASSSASASASAAVRAAESASASAIPTSFASSPLATAPRAAPSTGPGAPAIGGELPRIPDALPALDGYEGETIVGLRAKVRGSIWTTPPELKGPKKGDKFVLQLARAELARILQAGGFASGAIEVEHEAGGVELVYRLVPARFVRRVTFHGNALADEEVRRAAGLVEVPDVTEHELDRATRAIVDYYARRGWPKARVEIVTIESDAPFTVVVDVRVDPGLARVVDQRTFVGFPSWDAAAVAAAKGYAVSSGDRVDEDRLETADRDLASKLRAMGFVYATLTHELVPSKAAEEQGGPPRFDLAVTVVAGAKITPAFEGNAAFDDSQLMSVLDLAAEPDRSSYHLAAKVEATYKRRGFYDAKVVPELLGKPEDRQRTLMLHVHEGTLVTVQGRMYPCLHGALDAKRLDREIDSYLDQELESGGFGEIDPAVGASLVGSGNPSRGGQPIPDVPDARKIFVPETYTHATEHLKELFRSEGYMFVEIGEPRLVRATCKKSSPAGQCILEPAIALPDICRRDADLLPLESAPYPKGVACVPDAVANQTCAATMVVSIPVDPGPRSLLWDVAFDGALQITPAKLGSSDVAGDALRMGDPLSLADIEAARQRVIEFYKDEGFAFVVVKATIEYSPDKSRARVRYLVQEGEQVVVDEIRIEGANQTLESLIRDRMLLAPGGLYRAKWVRESIDRLNKLGVFTSVSIGLANPTIPAKRKTVLVTLVERKPNTAEVRVGFSNGEGARAYGEYTYNNLFGYAVALSLRAKASFQPFLFSGLYDDNIKQNWGARTCTADPANPTGPPICVGLPFQDRIARRISAGVTLPHTPLLGATVRTSLEAIAVLDLQRDFLVNKINPYALTFTWQPLQWFYATISSDIEMNRFQKFSTYTDASVPLYIRNSLHIPDGQTTVAAERVTLTFDWRDIRLGATKGGFVSLTSEYVKSLATGASADPAKPNPRQDFMHFSAAAGAYLRLFQWAANRPVVLAFELAGGLNRNVLSCAGVPSMLPANAASTDYLSCESYPDRLFYIGGPDSHRGFQIQQMLPQEALDLKGTQCLPNASGVIDPACITNAINSAPHGGNVYFNPRVELRIPAFGWGGFVLFADAANVWRDPANFKPWKLRYAIGPGISFDTPIGPIAADVGFNLAPYVSLGEPTVQFNFSIGRF
jgi:outer membrane protein assembly factor BamA